MKRPKNKKQAATPGQDAAQQFIAAQAQMAEVQALLLQLFEGTGSTADQAKIDESLKSIGKLLGFAQNGLEDDPEQLQRGLLQAFKAISQVSKNALQATKPKANPETEKLFALIRDFEADLAQQDAELAAVARQIATPEAGETQNVPSQDKWETREAHLQAIQSGMEKLLADQAIGLEGIFAGMERIMEQFADRLRIPKPKERDIVEEVSNRVSRELGEANKKNMIGEDFDWSSIWRKD